MTHGKVRSVTGPGVPHLAPPPVAVCGGGGGAEPGAAGPGRLFGGRLPDLLQLQSRAGG